MTMNASGKGRISSGSQKLFRPPINAMLAAPFTASWVSRRARWGSLEWLLNLRLHLLSPQFPACGSGPQLPREQEERMAAHPRAKGLAEGLAEGWDQEMLGQPALQRT